MENLPYQCNYYRAPKRGNPANQYTTRQRRNFLGKNQAIVASDQTNAKEEDKDWLHKTIEKAISQLGFTIKIVDCPMPVSTRNVGFTVQRVFNNSTAIPYLKKKLPTCTVFQMFRVMLAGVERKIQQNTDQFHNSYSRKYITTYKEIDREWLRLTDYLHIYPTNIAVIHKLFGKVQHNESTFVPVFASDQYDEDGKIIPVPEMVRFRNLENVVKVLAEKGNANFRNLNPLPGAIWDGDKLQNQYDFWPQNYTKDEFLNDINSVKLYLSTLGTLRPKWIIKIEPKEKGSGGVFVSVGRNDMKIQNGEVLGNADEFYSSQVLKKNVEIGMGVYGLVGELPSGINELSLWGRRSNIQAAHLFHTSFMSVCMDIE